jgi:hypothetical protein
VNDEDDEVCENNNDQDYDYEEYGLEHLSNAQPVVLVVDVEVLFVQSVDIGSVVKDDTVGHERGFESIVEVGNQPEVVYRHETNELKVLYENPYGQESNTTSGQKDKLNYDDRNNNPVHVLRNVTHGSHDFVFEVEDHLKALLGSLYSKCIGLRVTEKETSCHVVLGFIHLNINVDAVTLFNKEADSVWLGKLHSKVYCHAIVVEFSRNKVE